ncbi:Endo-1,4-beta-xylanase 5-like [Sesamum alatum]|uniref:Endo-1,4-beta-xylanase 5-like n=1 Tax=Sesamum alatum TaxID=300844 RepID=A0AAE1Y5W3_9LAMI|nr:Endo-1,4-beta-xylanase 5-like [Sesamum alatum]
MASKQLLVSCVFLVSLLNLLFGFRVHAVPYDHTFTHEASPRLTIILIFECLAKPLRPQYDGGIVVNPELNEGLKGWTTFGEAKLEHGVSADDGGNNYIVVSKRHQTFHSFSQKFDLDKDKLYTFSAWLQVSEGNADIAAVFRTQNNYETAGWVTAQKGCWSMLKGGVVVNASGPADLFFQSNNTDVDIWADSISLQPFTHEEWKSHQQESIEKVRKRRVKFQAVDEHGRPIANATVSIKQRRPNFPLGCAINQNILRNPAYQNWWSSRFKHTVFENELKWYSNERNRGSEDYSVSDALVQFARSRGAAIRGHNVLWNDPKYQPPWVGGLSSNDLWAAANKRVFSVVGRYKGQLFHWDVVNENLHFNFFESKLGYNASNVFYQKTNLIDPRTTPFLNEFNTIEESRDGASSPAKYLQKIFQLRKQGYNGPLGIGLEGHFSYANLPYIRSAIDTLASAKLPIWVTELDVAAGPNQANFLEQILWELHSHFAVQGIIIWAAWSPQGCYKMCLTDNNFKNLPTGNVVDKVRGQWAQAEGVVGTTDSKGLFEASLYHGEYEAEISHPKSNIFANIKKFSVLPNKEAKDLFHLKIKV